jgi:hypothetical protein
MANRNSAFALLLATSSQEHVAAIKGKPVMENDKFALSIGQAQQLEFAFQRNEWTAADVHKLCEKDMLAVVKVLLSDKEQQLGSALIAKLKKVGFSDDEIKLLVGPWEFNHPFPLGFSEFNNGEKRYETWWRSKLHQLMGLIRGNVTTLLSADLESLRQAARESDKLKRENRELRDLIRARIERPVSEIFTEDNSSAADRVRLISVFALANIATLRSLLAMTESEFLRIPNLGRKSLNAVKEILADMDLHLGMEIPI